MLSLDAHHIHDYLKNGHPVVICVRRLFLDLSDLPHAFALFID